MTGRAPGPEPDLYAALARLAALPRIVVGADFDGTLAPLVSDPSTAQAVEGAVDALAELASRPGTTVTLVSGRDLDTLTALARLPEGSDVGLVGSHGAASTFGGPASLDRAQARLLGQLGAELDVVAAGSGARVERKPTSVVLHTRGMDRKPADAALAEAEEAAARHTGVHVTPGKEVVELAVVEAGKGAALRALASGVGAGAVAYFGDDVTDETAFEALDGVHDVTVKVGDGPTAARFRVEDEAAVVAALRCLADLRAG